MKKVLIGFLLFFLLLLGTGVVLETVLTPQIMPQSLVQSAQTIKKSTEVSATVGEHYLTLSGWTSPLAKVILATSAGNVNRETLADETGFFLFSFVFLPYKIGEISLIAIDTNGLASPPLYLPEPISTQDLHIKNVLLPPSISLSSSLVSYQQTVSSGGRTFPNSRVTVFLYSEPKITLWKIIKETIIKNVFAKTVPKLEVQSDENGDFEFNLPSVEPAEEKIFVASYFSRPAVDFSEDGAASPKSFTLSFKTLSFWEKIAYLLLLLLGKIYVWIKSCLQDPSKIIVLEIPLLIFLLVKVLFRGWRERTTEI